MILEAAVNYPKSMRLLAEAGLRPLTYQEALARAPELIKRLRGKWFYLESQEIKEEGVYTFNAHGELVKPKGKEGIDKRVYVHSGNGMLALDVVSDVFFDWRFALFTIRNRDSLATVSVGVKIEQEAAAPKKIVSDVVQVPLEQYIAAQAELEKLAKNNKPEELRAITEILRD